MSGRLVACLCGYLIAVSVAAVLQFALIYPMPLWRLVVVKFVDCLRVLVLLVVILRGVR